MRKYIKLLIALGNLAAFIALLKDNALLRKKLAELTDKYWEGNRQIALYSDEVNKLKAQSVKKAHWEPLRDDNGNIIINEWNGKPKYQVCTSCGYKDGTSFTESINHCPGCGADMRG